MSAKARPYGPKPKKIGVHRALRTSWTAYTVRAVVQPVRRQTSQPDTAISTYSTVHTGPNSQDGGAHDGCSRLWYSAVVPVTPSTPISAAAAAAAPKPARAIGAERVRVAVTGHRYPHAPAIMRGAGERPPATAGGSAVPPTGRGWSAPVRRTPTPRRPRARPAPPRPRSWRSPAVRCRP